MRRDASVRAQKERNRMKFINSRDLILVFGFLLIFISSTTLAIDTEELPEEIEEPPTAVFDVEVAIPAMADGDGSGTPVCIDEASGLLTAGCSSAAGSNLPGQSCLLGAYVTGFDSQGNIICSGGPPGPENTEAACSDATDNDSDGYIDCEDAGCNPTSACGGGGLGPERSELACSDNGDNDGDSYIDCDDADCNAAAICSGGGFGPENTELACTDGGDNDGNGYTDCDDTSCNPALACGGAGLGLENTEARCTDGTDNDGDSWTDCADFDCTNAIACGGSGMEQGEAACSDGVDNDGDSWTDCDDWDCESTAVCSS
jgi:hypothetical protein